MAKIVLETKFFEFDQNNSGGLFHRNDTRGIGPRVWIEALDLDDACRRALDIGIYFDGCDSGMDCRCCGDRWSRPWRDDGKGKPELNLEYDFNWGDTVYVHRYDGTIERVKKGAAAA